MDFRSTIGFWLVYNLENNDVICDSTWDLKSQGLGFLEGVDFAAHVAWAEAYIKLHNETLMIRKLKDAS